MKQRRIPALFLFAAAPIFAATSAFADTTDTTVYDLDGEHDYSDTNLTVIQNTDGTLTGTLSGSGSFVKKGAANLTLNNTISLASGTIAAEEGSLTLGSDVAFSTGAFTINNKSTIVLAQGNGNSEALKQLTISDTEMVGTVVNNGAGTTTVSSLKGNKLRVNAGTLVVANETVFNEIAVARNASLQIGAGETGDAVALSGNVSLAENAALIFNRKTSSGADAITYSGQISGTGNLVFNGNAPVYFAKGVDQTYTGTTTINAGGMIFNRVTQTINGTEDYDPDAQAATLHSSKITVNGTGTFGGHVTVKGDAEVNGTAFTSYNDWTQTHGYTWGAWYSGAGTLYATGGNTITIEGDLNIAKTELTPIYTTQNGYTYISDYSGNSGGVMRADFDSTGAGKIIAKGNVSLGGTLILSGASGLATGQVAVFFQSDPDKTTGAFDNVVYGSDNVTLLLPGVGGIKEGQLGIATTENRNVRKRSSFVEHEGLSNFVDYLVKNSGGMNKVTQAIALADAGTVSDVVNNFSPLAYSAFPEMALRQSENEWNMILLNVAHSIKARPQSPDGVRVPANFSFFSGVTTDFVEHKNDTDSPVYDFNSVGIYAGAHTWLDDERIAGFSIGAHRGAATPHGSGGSLEDAALRAKIFAVFAPKFSDWFLTLGGTFAAHHYDAERETALGVNSASTAGADAGIFLALNSISRITDNLFFTPKLSLEYNFSYIGSFSEHGTASRLNVDRTTTNTYRAHFGSGFEYRGREGKTFALDFGFNATFGKRMKISSEFDEYEQSRTTTEARIGDRMSFELAPRIGLELGDGWTADAVYRAECSFQGSWNQSFNFGFEKRF